AQLEAGRGWTVGLVDELSRAADADDGERVVAGGERRNLGAGYVVGGARHVSHVGPAAAVGRGIEEDPHRVHLRLGAGQAAEDTRRESFARLQAVPAQLGGRGGG